MAARRTASLLRQLRPMATSATDPVLLSSAGATRTATLNRPKALNSLDLDMVRILLPAIREWDADPSVALIMMKGVGEKAFCAGGDVVSVAKSGKGGDDGGAFARDFFREEYILDYQLARLSKPYVALIDGITMGGGVGLSVPADFRVATERTLFAMPETGIGLFPDVGGSYYLNRLEGELGMYLALTGARLKGEDVVKAGIATHYVPSENLEELEEELAAVTEADLDTVATVLNNFDATTAADAVFTPHIDEINRCFSGDSVEAVIAALEASPTEWSKKQCEIIRRMSPTSLKLAHAQLRRGAEMSLEDCFTMEYRLTQGCMRGHDFYEGIRAQLLDKDRNPVWDPQTLDVVSDDYIESHFAAVENDLFFK